MLDIEVMVKTPVCPLSKIENLSLNILDIRGFRDEVAHLVEVDRKACDKLSNLAVEENLRISEKIYKGDSCIARIASKGCIACRTLINNGAFLVSGSLLENGLMSYRFIVSSRETLDRILTIFNKENIDYEIVAVRKLNRRNYLTRKQEEVLILSLRLGLFDHPRRIKISEISEMLGIRPSTFTEILRRGIRKILEDIFYT